MFLYSMLEENHFQLFAAMKIKIKKKEEKGNDLINWTLPQLDAFLKRNAYQFGMIGNYLLGLIRRP